MTSRERVQMVLKNQKPDRLPFNFWMDRDKMAELDAQFGENFRVCHYDVDVIETFPGVGFFWEFAGNAIYKNDGKTVWVEKHPVDSIVELKDAQYPDPDNPACYDYIKADRAKYPDKALFALMATPLEVLFGQVGMENLFYDMADEDELMDEILEKISQVYLKAIDHIAEADMDVLYLAGDICSTKNELMSIDMLRRFCFNPIKKLVDRAHELGLKVFFHTDGHVMNILPLFVEFGLDGINPFQVSANNDFDVFMEQYSDKLMIYGGIDNCFIIPEGTVDEVKNHINHLFNTLGKNGRLIASSHDIPSYVPMENLEAMVETIKICKY